MKYTIPTEGMSCGHCEMAITREVMALPGVKSVKADHKKKTVDVEVEDKADLKKITHAIKEAGYKPGNPVEKKKILGLF